MIKSKKYDIMKVLVTVLVVIAHSTRMYTGNGVITPANPSTNLSYITRFIYAFHMPLYICISGMVYGMCIDDFDKYKDTRKFIVNKAKRLLIPYYVFGLLWVAPVMTLFNFTDRSFIMYSITGIGIARNSRHLWFIFVLFLLFVISALCRNHIQKFKPYFALPLLLLLSYFSKYVPPYFLLNELFYYSLFFYLGYIFNRSYDKIGKICKHPIILILSSVCIALLCRENIWIFRIIVALAGIFLVIGIVEYINVKLYETKPFKALKQNGFGVYLFHPMIIYVLYYYWGPLNINPYILSSLIIVISYCISHIATTIIRKIRLGVIIGE